MRIALASTPLCHNSHNVAYTPTRTCTHSPLRPPAPHTHLCRWRVSDDGLLDEGLAAVDEALLHIRQRAAQHRPQRLAPTAALGQLLAQHLQGILT